MDESRKKFEQWRIANNEFANMAILSNGEYAEVTTNCAWHAWQASRAAIEIELPAWFVSDAIAVYDRDEVDEVIRAAGIKVKE
ncbi:hypothetical protein [Enterobacter genomosp. S]|uniref:Phage protein n=1 Tax=Enterobacter genomosp. S TaxID=2364151 RepID=A0ABR5YLK1_9ENTR|nr:hypothetical protein [Enterobacter genomosp. S]KZR30401.1 hypothetical protein A3466_07855 [Enterobacter genomosp. S]